MPTPPLQLAQQVPPAAPGVERVEDDVARLPEPRHRGAVRVDHDMAIAAWRRGRHQDPSTIGLPLPVTPVSPMWLVSMPRAIGTRSETNGNGA